MRRQLFAALLLVLATVLTGEAQSAPTLRFASPTDETYASGLVVLRVVVDGDSAASLIEDVTFFADGSASGTQGLSSPRMRFEL